MVLFHIRPATLPPREDQLIHSYFFFRGYCRLSRKPLRSFKAPRRKYISVVLRSDLPVIFATSSASSQPTELNMPQDQDQRLAVPPIFTHQTPKSWSKSTLLPILKKRCPPLARSKFCFAACPGTARPRPLMCQPNHCQISRSPHQQESGQELL